jgi:hypothetical protein
MLGTFRPWSSTGKNTSQIASSHVMHVRNQKEQGRSQLDPQAHARRGAGIRTSG